MLTENRFLHLVFTLAILLAGSVSFPQTIQDIHNKYRPLVTKAGNDSVRIKKYTWYVYEMMELNPDSSIPVLEKMESESRRIQSKFGIGKSLAYRAQLALNRNDINSALDLYIQSIPYFEAVNERTELGNQHHNIGVCFYYQGAMEYAVENFMKASKHFEATKDTATLSVVYNALANAFVSLEQFPKAINYYDKAEQIAIIQRDTARQVAALVNCSMVHGELEQWNTTFHQLYKALELTRISKIDRHKGILFLNLGIAHSFRKHFDSSAHYFRLAEPLLISSQSKTDLASLYRGMAKDAIFTRSYAQARDNALRSIHYAEEMGDPDAAGTVYGVLSEAYEGLGMYKQSLAAFKKGAELKDSVRNQKSTRTVNILETKYRTAQKEKVISEKMLALEQQKIALRKKDVYLIGAGILLLVLLTAGSFAWRNFRQQQLVQQQKLDILQKESELQATQAMMAGEEKERARIARNLHDGAGSMLSAARLYIGALGKQVNALPEIPAYRDTLLLLEEASAEIRETAHNLMPRILHEEGLNNAVEAFCNKFKQDKLSVLFQSYGIPARYNRHFELLVYRTIQELIHNSVKHAEASEIIVQLSFDKDLFSLTVEDDGRGFDLDAPHQKNGMGISDLRQRMEAFNGNTDIQSSGEGTVVYISFELSPLLQEWNDEKTFLQN